MSETAIPPRNKAERIRELYLDGVPIWRIADLTNTSVPAVQAVIHERPFRTVPEYRCPTCGGKVIFRPCLICKSRKA